MRNKFNRRPGPWLIQEQLRALQKSVQDVVSSSDATTREELFRATTEMMQKVQFANDEGGGLSFEPYIPTSWGRLIEEHIPGNINDYISNMEVVLGLLETLGASIVEGWNIATSRLGRVRNKAQLTASRLVDLTMFRNGMTDAYVWGDSFDNLSRLDMASPLLTEDLCCINDADGVVVLPLDTTAPSNINIATVTVTGNGVIGNNQEIGAEYHGTLGDILDNNPDTWAEYERVDDKEDESTGPLLLTVIATLAQTSIINEVRINPNNFGTARTSRVVEIESSVDGSEWLSIKDEVPFGDFVIDDEDNTFRLGPAGGKFSGIGIYMCLPRKAKYLRFQLSQNEAYSIETTAGQRLRYAIGIRDVEIRGNVYKDTGAILSKPISLTSPARKVFIKTAQNPASENDFCAIEHLISWNKGASWHRIKPAKFVGSPDIPEVLNLNGPEDGALSTGDISPTELRYKAILRRNSGAFQGSGTFREMPRVMVESFNFPTESPFSVTLQHKPISDVNVVFSGSFFGSKGRWSNPMKITATGRSLLQLPQYAQRESKTTSKVDSLNGMIDEGRGFRAYGPRKQMRRQYSEIVTSSGLDIPAGSFPTLGSPEYENTILVKMKDYGWLQPTQYSIDRATGSIDLHVFNMNPLDPWTVDSANYIPMDFEIYFSPEKLLVDGDIAYLEHAPAFVGGGGLVLKAVKGKKTGALVPLQPGETTHDLGYKNIIMDSIKLLSTGWSPGYDANPQDFAGIFATNLANPGEWTADLMNGYVHTYDYARPHDAAQFDYVDAEVLGSDAFEIIPGKPDQIRLKPQAFHPISASIVLSPSGNDLEALFLGHESIVKGSLRFTGSEAANLTKEVPFDSKLYTRVAANEILEYDGIEAPVLYRMKMTTFKAAMPNTAQFSNTSVFKTYKVNLAALTTDGDWTFKADNRTIVVRIDGALPADYGTVSYTYLDPTRELEDGGTYMVDYAHGILYIWGNFTASLTVDYQFLYILAEYDIGMKLLSDDFAVNGTKLNLAATAVKDFADIASSGGSSFHPGLTVPMEKGQSVYGQQRLYVTYTYNAMQPEALAELGKYFSPILRGYSLQIVTQDRMIT